MLMERLSHTFPKSAVQVKAILKSINLCNHSVWKLTEVSTLMQDKGFLEGAAPHTPRECAVFLSRA